MEYTIRIAVEEDAQQIHDIYGSYVDGLYVTFTTINPTVENYKTKIIESQKKYPFYVAIDKNQKILGYVCGSSLRPHDAYKWNVESTIMLSKEAPLRKGIASSLYNKFIETLKLQGYQFVYGVIVDTNIASISLHNKLGFDEVGHFYKVGYKNGHWLGIVWMSKYIGKPNDNIKDPIPFSDLM